MVSSLHVSGWRTASPPRDKPKVENAVLVVER